MRRWAVLAVVLFSIGIAGSAFAQGTAPRQRGSRQGMRGGGMRGMSVARIPVGLLKASLKLTDDQVTKIKAIQTRYDADTKALRPQPGAPRDPAAREQMRSLSQNAQSDIEGVLTPDQKAKLPALLQHVQVMRMIGLPAQALPDLKLTEDQRTKIHGLIKSAADQLKGVPQDQRREKMRTIIPPLRTQLTAILTPDQQKIVAKYVQRRGGPGGQAGAIRGRGGAGPTN